MVKISIDDYIKNPGLSRSSIVAMRRGANYYKWYAKDQKKTKAMAFGSALHTLAMESELFPTLYAVKPEGLSMVTVEGKMWKEANKGKEILSADEYATLNAMAYNIMNHPIVKKYFSPEFVEQSFFFTRSDVPLKCRPDFFNTEALAIFDIKTTSKPLVLRQLNYEIRNRGYDIQGAMCIDGLTEYFNKPFKMFVTCFVEKKPPYDVMCVEIIDTDLARARNDYLEAVEEYKVCQKTDSWPSKVAQELHRADLTFVDMEGEIIDEQGEITSWSQ